MTRSPTTAGVAYPSPRGISQTRRGASLPNALSSGVSLDTPLCFGPRKSRQSWGTAPAARGFGGAWNLRPVNSFASGTANVAGATTFGGAGSVKPPFCAGNLPATTRAPRITTPIRNTAFILSNSDHRIRCDATQRGGLELLAEFSCESPHDLNPTMRAFLVLTVALF